MQHISEFINKEILDFVKIGIYDEPELAKLGTLPFGNLSVELDALRCLRFFPNVKNLILCPGEVCEVDLKYLKGLPIISLKLDYYSDCVDLCTIDLAQFPNLQFLFSRAQYNFVNIAMCRSLCTLVVQEWYDHDLLYLRGSSLRALSILSGKLKRIDGIQMLPQIASILLANQRSLSDTHGLALCCNLESLAFEKCNRIQTSQFPALPNLRYLELAGSQKVENLLFLNQYPKLEYLLLDILVMDGNLGQLFQLKHCVILTDRRHYSAKNADLPKSQHRFHTNDIPAWLEILPQS